MLETALDFARGQQKQLDVYFVIHPKDSATYQAFQDQFKFSRAATKTATTSERRDPRPDVHGKSSEFTDSEIPCLIINGTSNEGVEEAEAWMKNVLQSQPVSIQNNLVLLFGKEEHDLLSSSNFQDVSIEEKLSNGTSVLKVDGLPQDKVRAVIQVERLLLDVQEKHAVTLEEELLEAAVVWFYRNKSGVRRYPTKANRELEKAFVTQSDLTLTSEPHHVICMKDLTAKGKDGTFQLQRQTITDSSKNGQKRRRPEDSLSHVLLVDPNSQEFQDHADKFGREKLTLVKAEVLSDSSSDSRDAPVLVPKKPSHRSKPDNILDLSDSLVNSTLFPSINVIPNSFRANPRCLFTCRRQGVNSSRI
ncbi:PREDICTED: uncharacterized protein LOC108802737 [Nanorana parkeri]|uniref:uncharacterized protein LOC108802737 n=1 Tax=Nanorana parkeri TaxID=125878 RepID=UPI000855055A|nr:PREDICTED: uncharacterized protein LOC108802737 [Nanorana parkeri]